MPQDVEQSLFLFYFLSFGPRRYSENGFDRDRVPRGLWADLRSVYEEAKEAWARGEAEREDCSPRDMYR